MALGDPADILIDNFIHKQKRSTDPLLAPILSRNRLPFPLSAIAFPMH